MVFTAAAAAAGAQTAASAAAPYAGAGAIAGSSLFSYNRKNFMYDRKMRQETEYQIMDFRIKQAELWREDVRDIIGLTSVKMDTYLVVNAVLLGFCVMAFCEGRLAAGTPSWLIGCHTLTLAGAFMYLLMAVWLAMHASVTAKSYEVRLMTQYVRLPMPTWAQLEGARTYGSSFEKVEPRQMFRVPFVSPQESVLKSSRPHQDPADSTPAAAAAQPGDEALAESAAAETGGDVRDAEVHAGDETAQTADLWGLEGRGDKIYELDGSVRTDPERLSHLKLTREAMQYWQSYDAFARVSMSLGTNQLILALSYYVLGYVLISNHAVVAAWLAVLLFLAVAAALIRLDMSLTAFEYRLSVILIATGPAITSLATEQWSRHTSSGTNFANAAMPFVYAVNALWLMFLLQISKVSQQKGGALLPTGFRSVMYIDVFGWIKRSSRERRSPVVSAGAGATPNNPEPAVPIEPGAGPAVQAVQYNKGRPVPARPEELPGAAYASGIDVKREDFEPTTFVPREKDQSRLEQPLKPHLAPGMVPWRIFCSATVLLTSLWWIVGLLVLLSSTGSDWLKVMPLLRESEEADGGSESGTSLLQVSNTLSPGERFSTAWPYSHVSPNGLACGGNDEHGWMVATSTFGLFVAEMQRGKGVVRFDMAPPCEGIEGESMQDVALRCNEGSCHAMVLHRQGTRVTSCSIGNGTVPSGPATSLLASTWLGEANAYTNAPQEEISSIALAKKCRSGDNTAICAYVETTGRRIVEVQSRQPSAPGTGGWFPARILRSENKDAVEPLDVEDDGDDVAFARTPSSGALSVLEDEHLGVLGMRGTQLELVNIVSGQVDGQWALPGNKRYAAVCGLGSSFYAMGTGKAPQLWRFPLPGGTPAVMAEASAGAADEAGEKLQEEDQAAALVQARNLRSQGMRLLSSET